MKTLLKSTFSYENHHSMINYKFYLSMEGLKIKTTLIWGGFIITKLTLVIYPQYPLTPTAASAVAPFAFLPVNSMPRQHSKLFPSHPRPVQTRPKLK